MSRIIVEYWKGDDILEETIISIIEILILGLSIGYLFCHTHNLRYSFKKTYILFYGCYTFFLFASLPFFDYYLIWVLYFFISLFIISHICFDDSLKKRLMMIGIFALIFVVEEMVTTVLSYMMFRWIWISYKITISYLIFKLCVKNIQMIVYCFFIEKLFSRELNHLKQFYIIPLGQGILLILLYYLGVLICPHTLGYILVILTLLILWSDYILYQAFLRMREENISNIKYIQSEVFTKKQISLKKLRHDLLNHYMVLETLIESGREEEINEYILKMKKLYEDIGECHDI